MRANYAAAAARIGAGLAAYEVANGPLPGIATDEARETLIEQIIDSERRVRYFQQLQSRTLDPASTDPDDSAFDPLRAAIIHRDARDYDEAVWMVFLFVHFGHHRTAGWQYAREVYGRLGDGKRWTWEETAGDPISFRLWLKAHQDEIQAGTGRFGNHRKYESLDAWSDGGTGAVVQSYVDWVLEAGGDHEARFADLALLSPEERFDELFQQLRAVRRFGRVARFDYLTTLQRLGLLEVRPPHSYLVPHGGPLYGACLLINGDPNVGSARDMQRILLDIGTVAGIAPDVLEDAACNWQKSPIVYERFSG